MFKWIGSMFVGVANWILKQLHEYLKTDGAKFVAEILPLAKKCARAAWEDGGTGGERFQNAKEKLLNELKDLSIDYSDYMINQAIEIAWGIIKEDLKSEGINAGASSSK